MGGFVFAKHAVDEGAEFQFLENPAQRFLVRLFADEGLHVELDGDIGLDGGQELGEDNLLPVRLDLRLQGALQLVGVGQQVLDAAELGDEFLCRLLAYARTAGDVVRRVAHQAQHVDDLQGGLDVELRLDFLRAHHLEAARVLGAVHEDVLAHQLAVVLVGRHHVGGDALPSGFGGQCAYHVVGLVARHLEDGDAVGTDDVLYNRYGEADGFGRLLALGLVLFVGLVAEGGPGRVEGHADVGGVLLFEHFFEGIDEAQDGRSVLPLRVDSRVLDERIVGAVDERVCVEQEKFIG